MSPRQAAKRLHQLSGQAAELLDRLDGHRHAPYAGLLGGAAEQLREAAQAADEVAKKDDRGA